MRKKKNEGDEEEAKRGRVETKSFRKLEEEEKMVRKKQNAGGREREENEQFF